MTDTSSWWARKLGRPGGQGNSPAPNSGASYGPSAPPTVVQTPAGIQAQMWQEQQATGKPPLMVEDDNAPGGKRLNWRAWAGGVAHQQEQGNCPNCGSTNYFSRKQNSMITKNGAAQPAPQCFECSYNGAFAIFGGG